MASTGYKGLEVWKVSMDLVVELYRLTDGSPDSERFGLVSQIRRASVSVPANIAEGYGRKSPASYAYFLSVAKGSTNEIETLLLVSERLRIASNLEPMINEVNRIGAMLTGLLRTVEKNIVREERSVCLAGSSIEEESP